MTWFSTPDGPVNAADAYVGMPLSSYDTQGNPQVNTLLSIAWLTEALSAGGDPVPMFGYRVNGGAVVFPVDQSVWTLESGGDAWRVVHAQELLDGWTLANDLNESVPIEALDVVPVDGWWRLEVSGDSSYMVDGFQVHNASRYWVGGGPTANVNATGPTNWGSASNTRDNASVPTGADNVNFDNSANGNSACTVNTTLNGGNYDFTAGASNYANTLTINSGQVIAIPGNGTWTMTFSPAMTIVLGSATSGLSLGSTAAAGTYTITLTSAGNTFGAITCNSSTLGLAQLRKLILADNAIATGTFTVPRTNSGLGSGVFLSGYTATAAVMQATTLSGAPTVDFGSNAASNVVLTGTGTVWQNINTIANKVAGNAISVTNTSATGKTFAGGNVATYPNLTLTGDNITVTGANTFATIDNSSSGLNGLILPAGSTTTCTAFVSTSGGSKLASSSAGSAATLSCSSAVNVSAMSVQDSTAAGTTPFVTMNGTNVSGNTNWTFNYNSGDLLPMLGVG